MEGSRAWRGSGSGLQARTPKLHQAEFELLALFRKTEIDFRKHEIIFYGKSPNL